ncbi:Frag1/DRAM/Sfk1 family-domain-containing protein [Mycena galericulata]|nr:Frag1/DRAM/Sfk1 family-domain-containing protein [Mycena galericulata]
MPLANSNEANPRTHWWYVWIPAFGAFIWFGTILSMLITWLAQGGTSRPRYSSQDESIAYISDVGADILKPLFVTGCCITAVAFFLSLVLERYLRHSGRLIPTMRRREKVFSVLAVLGSVLGGAGLILLSIFDTKRHPSLHRVFLLLFMVGVALSALFTCVEVSCVSRRHTASSPGILVILAWTISLGFTFYLLTFYYDLRQAKGVQRGELNPEAMRKQRRWATMRQRFG